MQLVAIQPTVLPHLLNSPYTTTVPTSNGTMDLGSRVPSHLLITAKLACVNCRVKKIRCDMTRPVCGNCVRHAQSHNLSPDAVNCEYIPISSPSSMTPPNPNSASRSSNSPPASGSRGGKGKAKGKGAKSGRSSQDDEDDKRIEELSQRLAFLENIVSNAMAVASADPTRQSPFHGSTSMSQQSSPSSASPTSPWDAANLLGQHGSNNESLVYPYPNASGQFLSSQHVGVGGFGGQPMPDVPSHFQRPAGPGEALPVSTFSSNTPSINFHDPALQQQLLQQLQQHQPQAIDWSWIASQTSSGNLSNEDLELLSKYYTHSM
ncbi:hypothetical protein BT69DRAFT_1278154 [Atractiella rhizophila]|nr:hypothetical protein BT69DRAFT_1279303 [Atractiella rhizophila]KAH8927238.1 hypothetical protein BT69DRAFT_1278154 [Atractiella rhizophila]